MDSLKDQVISVISKLPDDAEIEDIMNRLYILNKINTGQTDVKNGRVISHEDMKKEMASW